MPDMEHLWPYFQPDMHSRSPGNSGQRACVVQENFILPNLNQQGREAPQVALTNCVWFLVRSCQIGRGTGFELVGREKRINTSLGLNACSCKFEINPGGKQNNAPRKRDAFRFDLDQTSDKEICAGRVANQNNLGCIMVIEQGFIRCEYIILCRW